MLFVSLLIALLPYGYRSLEGGTDADARVLGPHFTLEPAARVRYGSGAGARLHCAAAGEPPPALAWLADDDTELRDEPGFRRVYSNGTLELLPTASPRNPSAPTTVRCRATNAHGTALSRDVTLEPVPDAEWQPVLETGAATRGGVAALSCRAAPDAVPLEPALWYRGDLLLDLGTPGPDSRYIVAGDTLLFRDVTAADAGPYSCLLRHALSGVTKRSRPTHLAVTGASGRSAPSPVPAPGAQAAAPGAPVCLPCAAPGPPPQYSWYREWQGRLRPVGGAGAGEAGGAWLWAGGAALCARAAPALSGAWLCKAYNAYGDATHQVRLDVAEELRVTIAPRVAVAPAGSTARLHCAASAAGAALEWLHDGRAAGAGATLVLRDVTRASSGVYQCRATERDRRAIATAELRLGDSPPELHYTFIEQALRGGGSVVLRCSASGAPSPRFTWLLDDQPLDRYPQHRYRIGSERSARGDVVSTLNLTTAGAGDGGRYACRAENRLGRADHSARLNIYGPPSIRALGPVRVVAGSNATVHCPYAGYPISSVTWLRHGASAALSGAGRVRARGAELLLQPALPSDAGLYACEVVAPHGPATRRDIEIQVRNPPKISPFIFSSELTEGSSAQVLCGVSSGDKPVYFSWTKDGAPLPATLQIEEKSLNEFSLLMFSELTARHSGEYACRVSNHAASVSYGATLSVKVAPAWVTEPLDAAVLLGAPILLECAAKGYPAPTVTWYRKVDEASLGPESEQWEQVGSAWGGTARSPAGLGLGVLMQEGESGVRVRDGALATPGAARRHQGVYRCTADNGVGPPLVKHVNLTVHEPANFESSAGNVSCVRGQSASLSCHALGDAPLTVHWSHRETTLDLNSYRWTVSEVRTSEGLRSTLQLRVAERGDAGEYRCHAQNQYGRSEVLMFLHVEEPPEAPLSVRLGGVGSRWVRVEWRAPPSLTSRLRSAGGGGGGSGGGEHYSALCTALHSLPGAEPPHTIFNLTLEPKKDDSLDADGLRTLAAKLESLRPAAAYSLRIVAGNHVGQSPHSEPLMFTTLEEAPSAPPQTVRVRPAGSGELHVSWSAPVQDSWNGELLGYAVTWRELGRVADPDREGRLSSAGWSSSELALRGLRSSARHAVTVRAYNRAGAGPASPVAYATTADGVPEDPPESVTCEATSSRSLLVRWMPAPATAHALRGYDVHCVPLDSAASPSDAPETTHAPGALAASAALRGLAPGANHSVWVRARAAAGPGPPSPPVYCATADDAPGAVTALRALAAGADALQVAWLPPARAPAGTQYALHVAERGAAGGARVLRVAGGAPGAELQRVLRGLRAGAAHELRVQAEARAGRGPPSRALSATPAEPGPARISSWARTLQVAPGARVQLACGAVGAGPLRRRWTPLPPAHELTDAGDLIIPEAAPALAGNYTCSVRNAGGADALTHALRVLAPPAAPAPRLLRAEPHALHLAWEPPAGAPVLEYRLRWTRADGAGGAATLPGAAHAHTLRRLACGARYRVWLRALGEGGASAPAPALAAHTQGEGAPGAAPAAEFVWANASALRLNLLAWRARCSAPAFRLALRLAGDAAAPWTQLATDGESAEAGDLRPGAWYEIRAEARSPAGATTALYRAATRALSGERIGDAVRVSLEARAETRGWRAPALLGGAGAALLGALAGALAVLRRRAGRCGRGECAARARLRSAEPGAGGRSEKTLAPPEGDCDEISPYATFSMSGGGEGSGACAGAAPPAPGAGGAGGSGGAGGAGGAGCALHLRTFGRVEELDLAAPPPRPNLLSHAEYGRARDSDSESSGSPCAACAHELYRLPGEQSRVRRLTGTAPHCAAADPYATRRARTPRRRREPPPAPAVRYFSPASLQARREALAL